MTLQDGCSVKLSGTKRSHDAILLYLISQLKDGLMNVILLITADKGFYKLINQFSMVDLNASTESFISIL